MRLRLGLFAALTLLAAIVALSLHWNADAATIRSAAPERPGIPVDVELVLAVDISYSMDPEEQALQREGYIKALTSREFLQALRNGMHGKIAVTYFEWAGYSDQRVVVPWRLIEGPESADAFASEIAAAPIRRAARTSISGAIEFGSRLFDNSGYRGTRRVIDISGDGANNNGQLVTVARDEAVAKGITINGSADHDEAAELRDHGYREARRLLRGLRDRRAGRLRHRDRGSRQVHRCDAHQAGARSGGPHAAGARHSGCGGQTARVLHHRRAALAGALGELTP